MPLAGGILQRGYQCGMMWGATLAAGARAYRLFGPGPRAETAAIAAAQRLVESFRTLNGKINCLEITGIDHSSSPWQMTTYFLLKGGTIGCFRMAARYAPAAYGEINSALAEIPGEVPPAPASCSAAVAQKMGVSDLHTVMAAGLAGGIGLSGGGCGALGAAVWITGMNSLREGAGKLDFRNPGAIAAVDRFTQCTGHEFECSKIVGRKFEDIGDHAGYIRDGGCSKIIETVSLL